MLLAISFVSSCGNAGSSLPSSSQEGSSSSETSSEIPSSSEEASSEIPSSSEEPSSSEPSSSSEEPSSEIPSSEPIELNQDAKYYLNPTGEPLINEQLCTFNPLGDIHKVWDYYRGDNVKVAVIDSGFDINHPDFINEDGSSAITNDSVYISYSSTKGISKQIGRDKVNITDGDSHGTMCAGLLGARVNDYGISGIAPNVDLMLIKIDKQAHSMAEAYKYAADNGAKVVSVSLGAYPNPYGSNSGDLHYAAGVDLSEVFNESINYAYEKGVTIVAATGNDNNTKLSYPAGCDNVIGAGGLAKGSKTKKWDNGYEGSNYNASTIYVDAFAPSEGIIAPGYDYSNNEHTYWSDAKGTSFAAPIIAGAAALYFQKYPKATNLDFENALRVSCTDISSYNGNKNMGYGALNVAELLNISQDISQIEEQYNENIENNVTKLHFHDEAGWDFRTLHLWGLKFEKGYGYTDFEYFLEKEYGNKINTSSYQKEGTTRGYAYTDEDYIGDYYLCLGNKDHAKPTDYVYNFPTYVKQFNYQIVNNSNWLPEGGLKVEANMIGNTVDAYFWYKGDTDTGIVHVNSNEKAYLSSLANEVNVYHNNNLIETILVSEFNKFTYSKDLYLDALKTIKYIPTYVRKNISLYY